MRLLQKTIRSYLVYSVFILLIAIPVFYLVIQSIVREDTDEHLQATRAMLRSKIAKATETGRIGQLDFADQDISLTPSRQTAPYDSLISKNVYDSLSGETVPYRILLSNFTANGQPLLLQIKYSMVDSEDLIESIVKVQVVLLLLLLAGLLLINRQLSQKIWKPFYSTLQKLRTYKVEEFRPLELDESSITEFGDLNGCLTELTERAHRTYLTQKEFTENASHEMQTPLAIFQSKLELLMQTNPIVEEQAILIDDLADAAQRMVRLNKSLILLTRIENGQFAEIEKIPLKTLIRKNISQLQPQAEEKQLTIDTDYGQDLVLEANRPLLEILVNNLLGNAIRHNFNGGLVILSIKDNTLTLQNTGRSTALDDGKIFSRFQKESFDPDSIGLGLQIVKQIAGLYKWTISYRFEQGLHSFQLLF